MLYSNAVLPLTLGMRWSQGILVRLSMLCGNALLPPPLGMRWSHGIAWLLPEIPTSAKLECHSVR